MKKISILFIMVIIVQILPLNVAAETKNLSFIYESNLISKRTEETIKHMYISIEDVDAYNKMDKDETVLVVDNVKIKKKNIDSDFLVVLSTLNEDNIIYESVSKDTLPVGSIGLMAVVPNDPIGVPTGITERYISKPSGMNSAVVNYTVSTNRFYQKSSSVYLTNNLARSYLVDSSYSSSTGIALKAVVSAMIGKVSHVAGACVGLIEGVITVLNTEFRNRIVTLVNKNKPIEIRFFSNNISKGRSVFEWNGKTVLSRTGHETGSGGYFLTETTTIAWSSKK